MVQLGAMPERTANPTSQAALERIAVALEIDPPLAILLSLLPANKKKKLQKLRAEGRNPPPQILVFSGQFSV